MKILFFGDGAWATASLRSLAEEGFPIVGVVLRRLPTDPALSELASELKLPIFQPTKVNDTEFISSVKALKPDINLSLSFDQILKRPIIESTPLGFVNFHAGKLPYYRGRNVINWAIINGEPEIGLTGHYVDDGIDTGDIILQRTLPIEWTDTYSTVLQNVIRAFPELVVSTVRVIAEGAVKPQSQSSLLGTYFPARKAGDEWLDWSDHSRNLYNKIRAITRPGPGSQTLLGDKLVKIWRAYYDPAWPCYLATPGEVVRRCSGEGVMVKTGDSTILLQEVQVCDQDVCVPTWPIGTRLGLDVTASLSEILLRLKKIENIVNGLKKVDEGVTS